MKAAIAKDKVRIYPTILRQNSLRCAVCADRRQCRGGNDSTFIGGRFL